MSPNTYMTSGHEYNLIYNVSYFFLECVFLCVIQCNNRLDN